MLFGLRGRFSIDFPLCRGSSISAVCTLALFPKQRFTCLFKAEKSLKNFSFLPSQNKSSINKTELSLTSSHMCLCACVCMFMRVCVARFQYHSIGPLLGSIHKRVVSNCGKKEDSIEWKRKFRAFVVVLSFHTKKKIWRMNKWMEKVKREIIIEEF